MQLIKKRNIRIARSVGFIGRDKTRASGFWESIFGPWEWTLGIWESVLDLWEFFLLLLGPEDLILGHWDRFWASGS